MDGPAAPVYAVGMEQPCARVNPRLTAQVVSLLTSGEFASTIVKCIYRGVFVRVDPPALARLARHIQAGRVVITDDPDEGPGPRAAMYVPQLNLLYLPAHLSLQDPFARAVLLHEAVHALQDEQRWPTTSPTDLWMMELLAHIVEAAFLLRVRESFTADEPRYRAVVEFVRSRPRGPLMVSQADLEAIASKIRKLAGPADAVDMASYVAPAMQHLGGKFRRSERIHQADPFAYPEGIAGRHIPACRAKHR